MITYDGLRIIGIKSDFQKKDIYSILAFILQLFHSNLPVILINFSLNILL